MKKFSAITTFITAALLLSSLALSAQETTVTIQVKEDGKIVKDTSYTYDDASQAKHALKILEVMSDFGHGEMDYEYTMSEHDGDHVKVIKHHSEGHPGVKHVVVVTSEDGEKYDIHLEGHHDGDCVKKKEIKVIVSGDDDGEWEVIEEEIEKSEDEEVIVIKKKAKTKKQ